MAVVVRALAVGDRVRWASATRGVWRHHEGVIVAVVPAGGHAMDSVPDGRWVLRFRPHPAPRPQVSYLVAAIGVGSRAASGLLYHPRSRHVIRAGDAGPLIDTHRRRGARAGSLPVVIDRIAKAAPNLAGRTLRNGATFIEARACRDLVPYRRAWAWREVRWLVVASPVLLALLALLVIGMAAP